MPGGRGTGTRQPSSCVRWTKKDLPLDNERFLGMESDDFEQHCGWTYCHCTAHLKMVQMVNFMLCMFYHNKIKINLKKVPET